MERCFFEYSTTCGKAVLYLPASVRDQAEAEEVEKAIALQVRAWRRSMEASCNPEKVA